MDPNSLPATEELMLDHIIEEASEVIKACIKIKRFGKSPGRLLQLMSEVDDVQFVYNRYNNAV